MPKPDAATSATIGHFYLIVSIHGQTFWVSVELAPRSKRKMLTLSQTPLFADAFTTEELPAINNWIWKQFKGAEILPFECNTREILPAIMRKTINA